MSIIKPTELLQEKLDSLIRTRQKSIDSFNAKEIDEETHLTHLVGLTPAIENYKYVLRVIKQYA